MGRKGDSLEDGCYYSGLVFTTAGVSTLYCGAQAADSSGIFVKCLNSPPQLLLVIWPVNGLNSCTVFTILLVAMPASIADRAPMAGRSLTPVPELGTKSDG